MLHKALMSSADGVVADLEDGVAPAEKQNARAIIGRVLTETEKDAAWIGALDLGLELRLEPRSDGHELLWARSNAVLDSAAADIRGPFDAVHPDVRDDDGLDAECRLVRSLGLRGKLCIHPRQVQVVNAVFASDDAELDRSRRVVDAYEAAVASGRGVVAMGEMIDLPVVERASRALGHVERRVPDGE